MSSTTKIYRNDGTESLNVLGVGVIEPGEQISVTAEYQPPVNIVNYPGLVECSDEPGESPSVPSIIPLSNVPEDSAP